QVEGRETETQGVRFAKVADHAALDQGAHDRIALRVPERDMTAALGGVARTCQSQTEAGATLLDEGDEDLSELAPLALDVGYVETAEQVEARLPRAHAEHARRSPDEAADP